MTVLFRLDTDARTIARQFGAFSGNDPWAGGHVAPGAFAPVITEGREFVAGPGAARQARRMVPRLWGVPPPPSAGYNARPVLSVANPDSPFWIGNLRNREFRCLVPATSFMVWGAGTNYEGRRLRHWLAPEGEPLFAFAGLWKDSEVPSFALLTRPATDDLRALGCERMPLVLPGHDKARDLWLRGGWDRAGSLLEIDPEAELREIEAPARA